MLMLKRIMAIIVVAGLVGAFGYRAIRKAKVKAMTPLLESRAMIFDRVSAMVKMPAILEYAASHPANLQLRQCLVPNGRCNVLTADQQAPFVVPASVLAGADLYAGTADLPARYDRNGKTCHTDCAWQADAYFWGECDDAPCIQAHTLHVRLVVRPLDEFDWPMQPQSTPPAMEFTTHPERFSYRVALRK